MAQIALVNPQLLVNNIAIPYVPNSLKFDLGLGEQDVKATAGGGGTAETVYFNNVEANVGMVSFEMYSTDVSVELHEDWKSLGDGNGIEIVGEGGVTVTYQRMAQTSKVEIEVGNDKMVTFEFKGAIAIVGS